jgi:hypothetical protein
LKPAVRAVAQEAADSIRFGINLDSELSEQEVTTMNDLRVDRVAAALALLFLAGCATVGHPCFSDRVMFADRTVSCQYGREYQCDNGDWIAARRACNAPAPEVAMVEPADTCEFGGISFASGSSCCNAGTQYRCDRGHWASLDRPCAVGDAPYALVPSGEPCSYRGGSVANSSAICQSGTTYLCSNGQWVNLGTMCE